MRIPTIKIGNVNNFLKRIAFHPFYFFCFLFFASLIIVSAIFLYCQAVLMGNLGAASEPASQVKEFDAVLAREVLGIWEKRGEDFKNANSISYPDFFDNVIIDKEVPVD